MTTPVVLAKCASYNFAEVLSATERIIAALGGLQRFIRPGQTVLLKPNLLTARTPDQAVTTHPAVIRALIHMVRAGPWPAGNRTTAPEARPAPLSVSPLSAPTARQTARQIRA